MARERLCKNCNEKPASWRTGGFCSYSCKNEYDAPLPEERRSQPILAPARPLPAALPHEFSPMPKTGPPPEDRKGVSRETAEAVIERDGDRCRWCGGPRDQLHHILYRSQCGSDTKENLICLCRNCHELVHTSVRVYRPTLFKLIGLPFEICGKDILD